MEEAVRKSLDHFAEIVREQLARVARLRKGDRKVDFRSLRPLRIGFIGGDGIGPVIAEQTRRVLEHLLREEIESGKIEVETIEGLTIENRFRVGKAVSVTSS